MEPFKLPSIPTPKPNDPEDVSWALSTAEAMWGRGDHAEAIKWIRRGAEAASEAEADDRALELAKAAADLASMIVRMSQPDPSSARPPVGSPGPPPQTNPPPRASTAPAAPSREAPSVVPVPVTTRSVPPPSVAPPRGVSPSVAPPARPASNVPPPGTDKSPRPLQTARGPERVLSTTKGVLSPRIETKRRSRSSASFDEEARAAQKRGDKPEKTERLDRAALDSREAARRRDAATAEDGGTQADMAPPGAEHAQQHAHEQALEQEGPVTTDELNRTSEHDSMAAALSSMAMALPQADAGRKKSRRSRTNEGARPRAGSVTDEWDAQPTQSLSRAELDSITNEHSLPQRMLGAGKAKDLLPPLETSPRGQLPDPMDSEPGSQIIATQAVRVLLWRDAEGVHVAPSGTVVSAIAVDAILVALSPSVDLSAWLDPGLMSGRISPSPSSEASDNASSGGTSSAGAQAKGERSGDRAERNERSERNERNEKARGKLPK